ncbi:hypothetical protein CLACE_11030 [Clostridium acetobutylicum]|nr:hypothetical protein CLACE_11030 [Clostridium acetobutylicum]OOM04496.1 hypothetical protein CLABU_31570 [Clostridium acetobutylicum]
MLIFSVLICLLFFLSMLNIEKYNENYKNKSVNIIKIAKVKKQSLSYEKILHKLNGYDEVTVDDIKEDDKNTDCINVDISFPFSKDRLIKIINNFKKDDSISGIDNIVVNNKDNNKDCKIQLKFNR